MDPKKRLFSFRFFWTQEIRAHSYEEILGQQRSQACIQFNLFDLQTGKSNVQDDELCLLRLKTD